MKLLTNASAGNGNSNLAADRIPGFCTKWIAQQRSGAADVLC